MLSAVHLSPSLSLHRCPPLPPLPTQTCSRVPTISIYLFLPAVSHYARLFRGLFLPTSPTLALALCYSGAPSAPYPHAPSSLTPAPSPLLDLRPPSSLACALVLPRLYPGPACPSPLTPARTPLAARTSDCSVPSSPSCLRLYRVLALLLLRRASLTVRSPVSWTAGALDECEDAAQPQRRRSSDSSRERATKSRRWTPYTRFRCYPHVPCTPHTARVRVLGCIFKIQERSQRGYMECRPVRRCGRRDGCQSTLSNPSRSLV